MAELRTYVQLRLLAHTPPPHPTSPTCPPTHPHGVLLQYRTATHNRVFELEGRRSPLGRSTAGAPAPAMDYTSSQAAGPGSAAASPARMPRGSQFAEQQVAVGPWAESAAGGAVSPQRVGRRPASATLRTTQPAARRLWKQG